MVVKGVFIAVLLASLFVSYFLTPVVKQLAVRLGALDRPKGRSVHTAPTPYLGGLAIYAAFALTLIAALGPGERQVVAILVGGGLVVALGIADDFLGLPALLKLAGQVVTAGVLVALGVRIEWLTNPAGGMIYLGVLGVPLTIFWVVTVVNVVNLADGLDGLAAGISSIASLTLLFVALREGQAPVVILTAALAGSALGFLPHNFNPAKIFMGDAGSMFLGFALAAVSVEGTLKSATAVALAVPIVALGLPIFDTFFAIVRRVLQGRPIHEADGEHIHHRLLRKGLTHRQVVVLMYLVSVCLGLTAILLREVRGMAAALLLLLVVAFLLFGAKVTGILEIQRKNLDQ